MKLTGAVMELYAPRGSKMHESNLDGYVEAFLKGLKPDELREILDEDRS